ncbi:MAG: hypothetical protein JSV80_10450 [Acidobacteriota bacterium]|nr:MAG: hypothetical protein JSV80_10450 [Acidobacteriota bacterium]
MIRQLARRVPFAALVTMAGLACSAPAIGDELSLRFERQLQIPISTDPLLQPLTVHADLHAGEVFVGDRRVPRIAIFDSRGVFRFAIRGGALFNSPIDIATWPDGHILLLAYVEKRPALVRLDFDGQDPELIELKLPEEIEQLDKQLNNAWLVSVALSPEGDRIYVLDEGNLALWISDPSGQIIGWIDFGEGLDEQEAQEMFLTRVDVYRDTILVPLPTEGSVRLYDLDGRPRGRVGRKGGTSCETAFPVAAALDAQGRVLMLDRQRMLVMLWRIDGNRCLGEASGIGRNLGRLYFPADLALDARGRVLVGQGFKGRVQAFSGAEPAALPQ